ncbi:uncharacterized protein LOC120331393 [Styela clava]
MKLTSDNSTVAYFTIPALREYNPKSVFHIKTICRVVNAVLLACTMYIIISLIIYGIKNHRWKKSTGISNVNGGVIYTACIVAVILFLPRLVADAVLINISLIPGGLQMCEVVFDITNGAYTLAAFAIYSFLWFRQLLIYAQPTVRQMTGKYANPLGWFAMSLLIIMSLGLTVMFTLPTSFESLPYGCVINLRANLTDLEYFFKGSGPYLMVGLQILAQLILLGLFIYPLALSNSAVHENNNISRGNDPSETGIKFYKIKRLFSAIWRMIKGEPDANIVSRTIHRSMVCCSITISSDIFTMAIVLSIPEENLDIPRVLPTTLYDISIMINVFCIVATFQNTRGILKTLFSGCAQNIERMQEPQISETTIL